MNPPKFSDGEAQSQLDWSAFAYVAGDLSPGEVEAFEQRLEHDQAAREAVARAVALAQVIAAAESELPAQAVVLPTRTAPAWTSRLAWLAIGGLASLVLAIVASQSQRPAGEVAQQDHFLSNGELATVWSATREELAASESGLWYLGRADQAVEASFEDEQRDMLTDAPGWMTAGVYGLAGLEAPESQGDDGEGTDGATDELPIEPFTTERGDN